MAYRIKEGSKVAPFGPNYAVFTSESDLSQDVLSHLAEGFPEDVVDDTVGEDLVLDRRTKAQLKVELTNAGIAFDEKATNAELIALLTPTA